MIKLTKTAMKANALTHDGKFHADDVLATVILSKLKKITLYRTSRIPPNLKKDVIIFDIGGGELDHHQKGGNGARENGVPYAAAGLVWKKYGMQICRNTPDPEFVWNLIDRDIIQGVDASDNGACPKTDYPARAMSLSRIVASFKPTWDSDKDFDEAFMEAFSFVKQVFDNVFAHAVAKAKAKPRLNELIQSSKNEQILVLKQYLPWKEFIFDSENQIKFVVYPSNRGGYNWHGVPMFPGSFESKTKVPTSWKGLKRNELRRLTKVPTATFCHAQGFIGGAERLEDAVAMAQLAISANN